MPWGSGSSARAGSWPMRSSLAVLAARTGALADDLRSSIVEDSLDDVRAIVTITMLVLASWAAAPAVGAPVVGVRLRRIVAPEA